MFDSHSVGTGISSSASSSLSLFLFSSCTARGLVPLARARIQTDVFSRSLFRRLSAVSAARSAPDYLGSECLIGALYRTDSELLASLGPAPLLEFGGGDTTSSFSLSLSIAAFTLSPLSASRQLLSPPHPPPPPLYIYSFICWWLIPHYRDRSTDKRNVLGNTQCAPPFSRLSRSFLAIGSRREEGRLRDGGEDKDEAASGAEAHILRATFSFLPLVLRLPRLFLLFPLSSSSSTLLGK